MNKKALILAVGMCVPAVAVERLASHSRFMPHLNAKHAIGVTSEHIHGQPMVFGGIHSLVELEQHAGLYPGCDVQNATFTTLDHNVLSYVSYTFQGKEHWTRHERLIPKGEMVIQAGSCTILQRCGNEIKMQPPIALFDESIDPFDVYPPILSVPVPTAIPTLPYVPSDVVPTLLERVGMPGVNNPPQMGPTPLTTLAVVTPFTPVSVSEPSTLSMLFAGLVAIWGMLTIPWRTK